MPHYEAETVRDLAEQLVDRPPGHLWPDDYGLTYSEGEARRLALRDQLRAYADSIDG